MEYHGHFAQEIHFSSIETLPTRPSTESKLLQISSNYLIWSEWPRWVLPAGNVPMTGARYSHPTTRGEYYIAEGVVNTVRATRIAHSYFATHQKSEEYRGGDCFRSKEKCSWKANANGSRHTQHSRAAAMLRFRLHRFCGTRYSKQFSILALGS